MELRNSVEKVFLGWERPFLNSLSDWLWQRREKLPEMVVVVPTKQSGRRLRQTMAEKGGVLGLNVIVASSFLSSTARWKEHLAWLQILQTSDPKQADKLIPNFETRENQPAKNSAETKILLADELSSLAIELKQAGINLQDESEKEELDCKWRQFQALAKAVDQIQLDWNSRSQRELPKNCSQVVLAGIYDSMGAVVDLWQSWEVEIVALIAASKEQAQGFDDWGMVNTIWWNKFEPTASLLPQIKVVSDVKSLSSAVVKQIAKQQNSDVALGICDAQLLDPLVNELEAAEWKSFLTGGRQIGHFGLIHWLILFLDIRLQPQSLDNWMLWLKESKTFILAKKEADFSVLFQTLEDWKDRHLSHQVQDLLEARWMGESEKWKNLENYVLTIRLEVERLDKLDVIEAIVELLEKLAVVEAIEESPLEEIKKLLHPWKEFVETSQMEESHFLPVLRQALLHHRTHQNREEFNVDLLNWNDLLYESSSILHVVGCHETTLPTLPKPHFLLTKSWREKWQLNTKEICRGRDFYLLNYLKNSRKSENQLTFWLCQHQSNGILFVHHRY